MVSNHELAKRYKEKSKLIGKDILDIRLIENDRVILDEVMDKEDNGRLVIPSFITDINKDGSLLYGCKYEEIYIDNRDGVSMRLDKLCAWMQSSRIVLKVRSSKDIVSMNGLFGRCEFTSDIDISGLDTSNVEDMSYMFYGCKMLNKLDLSNIDISKVETIEGMFSHCESISSIDITNFNTKRLKNMRYLFERCYRLKEIKGLSELDVSGVIWMSNMFAYCENIDKIDISKWDIKNVEDMRYMFLGCKALKSIKLCDIDDDEIDTEGMLMGCRVLDMSR